VGQGKGGGLNADDSRAKINPVKLKGRQFLSEGEVAVLGLIGALIALGVALWKLHEAWPAAVKAAKEIAGISD
jgi:hypothetical protein